MNSISRQVCDDLAAISASPDFVTDAYQLVERWTQERLDSSLVVEGIFRFLEQHREMDVGSPGPLVHFAEALPFIAYKKLLIQSLERNPTPHTVWMLNRTINGSELGAERRALLNAMRSVVRHPQADDNTQSQALHFIEYQGG